MNGTMHIGNLNAEQILIEIQVPETRVKYTQASGLADWEGLISGEIVGSGRAATTQIPQVTKSIEIRIGNAVTSIGTRAFMRCSNLTKVSIPNSVTSIGNNAFWNCSGLTSVTIPDGVTSIGDSTFYGCGSLTSVTIPNSVASIGNDAFSGCWRLMAIEVSDGNVNYSSANSLLLSKDGKILLQGVNGNVTIPDSVTNIANNAFYNCSGLTSVTIPDGVTSIGWSAFNGCGGLKNVTIPDSVTDIGWYAFDNCGGLTGVTIGNGVTSIGWYAFRNCSNCFVFDFRKSTSIPTLSNVNAFNGTPSNKEIIVPDSLYDNWKAASNWSSTSYNIVNCIVKASQSSLGTL